MSMTTLGDAARFLMLRRDGIDLRAGMARLTSELSTGQVSDPGAATGGRFADLSDITRGLALNRSFATGIASATLHASAREAALDRIAGELDGVAPRLLSFATGGSLADMTLANADTPTRFASVVTTLNTRLGAVALFSADRSDQSPLIGADAMLDALRPLVTGAATASDFAAAVTDWFTAPGGGFETIVWQGGAGTPPPVILSEGVSQNTAITALDPDLRGVLSGLAMAALAAEGAGPADPENRRAIITLAAERLQTAEDGLIGLRASLGIAQGRIDEARVRTEAHRATLEQEQSRILGADPYRTATELRALETQLESHYLLTARLSRLSLSEYLR